MARVYAIDGIRPVVDPSAFVHPDATLIGDVIVGANCYVGPGAVLRGDMGLIRMEPGSNMQDNCIAHSFVDMDVVLGEFANVGHGAVLHGCKLGRRTLIGMNSVIMDGAVIGDESFVAALCFVGSGFEVPPRKIAAGIPAKILRDVTEEELVWKKLGDEDYQNVIRRSRASLEAVEPLTSTDGIREGTRIDIDGVPPLYKARGTLL
jgi:phenylacetic acid degradation protein